MTLNEIAKKHYAWLEKMGWTIGTTPLEQLALITSEIGEAVNECRGNQPTDKLGSELADIILRTVGLSERLGINIEETLYKKMETNEKRGNLGRVK
jgi:NTP pyrophosphatase (non-canonical NTP hydrolase)